MAYQLPNGSTFDFASGYTPFFNITAITRSENAQITAPGHTFAVGQIVMIKSGWYDIDGRAFRVLTSVPGTSFTIEGADTRDINRNASGAFLGTVRGVSGWIPIPQILEVDLSGGEQQYTTYSPSRSGKEVSRPTVKSASNMSLVVADDPQQVFFATVEAAARTEEFQVQRLNLANTDFIVYCTLASVTRTPNIQRDQLMTRQITLALQGDSTRYGAT